MRHIIYSDLQKNTITPPNFIVSILPNNTKSIPSPPPADYSISPYLINVWLTRKEKSEWELNN